MRERVDFDRLITFAKLRSVVGEAARLVGLLLLPSSGPSFSSAPLLVTEVLPASDLASSPRGMTVTGCAFKRALSAPPGWRSGESVGGVSILNGLLGFTGANGGAAAEQLPDAALSATPIVATRLKTSLAISEFGSPI